ncbi:MAG: tetratricopeptide repeat protein [Oscillatoria sp. PMC 1051.18]|nr:tetratricopeptide repeat protein [Oscillatoria sp. PMC 1050.18]MEC5032232.1 tetratricopeptide repeat protein [Oscillatoria sp. PMC 1051.18]
MNELLPLIYLSVLLVILAGSAVFIFRQVFQTRKTETNLSQLQKKLKQEQGTPLEYYQLGSIYLDKKLFVQAAKLFQKALRVGKKEEPENLALIHNALGYAYFAQEQYDMAIREYKEAVKNKADYITALNNLANAYERKKLTAQALEIYEQTLTYDPNNSVAKRRAESLRKRLVTSN